MNCPMDTDEDIPSEPELPPGFRWVSAGRVAPAVGSGKAVSSRLMFRLGQTCVGDVLLDDKLKKMIGPTDLVVHREAD